MNTEILQQNLENKMEWIANHKLDKLEEKIDFYKSESLFGSPALALALRCQAELIDNMMWEVSAINLKNLPAGKLFYPLLIQNLEVWE